jgi:hypothetical protein
MPKRPGQKPLEVMMLTLDEARDIVDRLHRHHKRPQGHKISIGVHLAGETQLRGVAIVGRATARCFDNRYTLEVTRVATDGTPNACSRLYGAVWGGVREFGIRRVITYTQDGESGASLRAVGWKPIAVLRPRTGWDTPSRRREDRGTDGVARILWEQRRVDAPELPPLDVLRNEIRNEILCEAVGCGRPFTPSTGPGRPARFCSDACRLRSHRARRRDEAA